ncbi:MAG TPA: hypothetical protein P5235_12220, partial [Saprospiraceae bacterium]|nr:hypothetical protein [Saprospiraceae bacterium]
PGDQLPSGYAWVNNGNSPSCENSCSPSTSRGVGSTYVMVNWDFCMKVKTFPTSTDCFDQNDLYIHFQTLSDGIAGCWEDPVGECLLDKKQFSPPWRINCDGNPSQFNISHYQRCDSVFVSITFGTPADLNNPVLITPINATSETQGANGAYFNSGENQFLDTIVFTGTEDYQLKYLVELIENGSVCSASTQAIIPIYKKLELYLPDSYNICQGDCITINAGTNKTAEEMLPMEFEWTTVEYTPSITVCPDVTTTYTLRADGSNDGCVVTSSTTVHVSNGDENELKIFPNNGNFCTTTGVDTIFAYSLPGVHIDDYYWMPDPGLVGHANDQPYFIIDKEKSSNGFQKEFQLCVNGTSQGYCGTDCITINLSPDIKAEINYDYNNCEKLLSVDVDVMPFDNPGFSIKILDCDANVREEDWGYFAFFEDLDFTNPSDTCFSVLIIDELGCEKIYHYSLNTFNTSTLNINGDTLICPGDNAMLSIENPNNFTNIHWGTGQTSSSILVSPTVTTTYIAIALDEFGCQQTASFTVQVSDSNDEQCAINLSGLVINDENSNCLFDAGEAGLSSIEIVIESASNIYYVSSNSFGNFDIDVEPGVYKFSIASNYYEFCNASDFISIDAQSDLTDLILLLQAKELCYDLTVDATLPLLRRCTTKDVVIVACNNGVIEAENAYIDFYLGDELTVISNPNISELGNNQYRYTLDTIYAGECKNLRFAISVSCQAPLIKTQCLKAQIYPESNCNYIKNYDGAYLSLSESCEDGWVNFEIKNNGAGDMENSQTYNIFKNEILYKTGPFKLKSGESYTLAIISDGETYTLNTLQIPEYPFSGIISTFVEGCAPDGESPQYFNFMNIFHLDDRQPYIDIDCGKIVAPYDPNDKSGSPIGYTNKNYVNSDQSLTYTIQFENVGNDTAFDVRITDAIDENLDLKTLKFLSASGDFSYSLNQRNLLIELIDIQLPPTVQDSVNSRGFVRFSIAPNAGLPLETEVHNQAEIFFDFNDPIITNQTLHTFGSVCLDELFAPIKTDYYAEGWEEYPCVDQNPYIYSIKSNGLDSRFMWSGNGIDNIVENDSVVTVWWKENTPGKLCVIADDQCFSRDTFCHIINIQNTPQLSDDYFEANPTSLSFSITDNDDLSYVSSFIIRLGISPEYGQVTFSPSGNMTYLPFDDKIDFIDTFSYKICNELCPDLCNEAKVIINFDKDAVGTKDIYEGYTIYELLKLEPCKVQLFNTMGQEIYNGIDCNRFLH